MEYRNNNSTPRDRLDEQFIRELLDLEFDDRSDNERSCTGELRNNRSDYRNQAINSSTDIGYNSYTERQGNTREKTVTSDSRDRRDNRMGGRDSDNGSSGCGCSRSRNKETREHNNDNNQNRRDSRYERNNHERSSSGNGCGCRKNNVREARAETLPEYESNDTCPLENSCGCGDCGDYSAPMLRGVPLAMVYSPYQEWGNLYEPEEGHHRGTIFRCLDFPFYPTGCNNNGSSCGCSDNDRRK